MTSSNASASVPDPPSFYKRYTNENLALLEKAKNQDGSEKALSELDKSLPNDFNILDLEPPPPITDGSYEIFGIPWQVISQNATLKDNGTEQLYPEGEFDRVAVLKKLNKSVVFNFLALLDSLTSKSLDVSATDQANTKVTQLKTLFMNMKQLCNEYRPHQARETLLLLIEEQIRKRKAATEEAKRRNKELEQRIEFVKNTWTVLDQSNISVDKITQEDQYIPPRSTTSSSDIKPETVNTMLQIIDQI